MKEEGQGLCPWTPLGPSRECVLCSTAPDPHLFAHVLSHGVWGLVPSLVQGQSPWTFSL